MLVLNNSFTAKSKDQAQRSQSLGVKLKCHNGDSVGIISQDSYSIHTKDCQNELTSDTSLAENRTPIAASTILLALNIKLK